MHDPDSTARPARAADELSECAEALHIAMWCVGPRVRLEILAHLAFGPMHVNQITAAVKLDNTLVSKYLKALRKGGIVRMRKDKKKHIFSLAPEVVVQVRGSCLELKFPVAGGMFASISFPEDLLRRLHPDLRLPVDSTPIIEVRSAPAARVSEL